MIEQAHFQADGMIHAVIDQQDMTVPDDMNNRHRMMLADWEAQGNVIAPYKSPVPGRVSRRQFRLQLEASQLLDKAEAWIASQDRATQIAYEDSDSFNRNEPKLQEAFAAVGYSPADVDAFFVKANQR